MSAESSQGNTLYVKNLSEKIPKQELRRALFSVFSSCGRILEVVVARTYKLRGQAWIVYDREHEAQLALQALQGFPFYDKPMTIIFSNSTSDIILRQRGEDVERDATIRSTRKAENQERERLRQNIVSASSDKEKKNKVAQKQSEHIIVEGLPAATTTEMLTLLFKQFSGFKNAQMLQNDRGRGRVEFESISHAIVALNGLQGFRLNATHSLSLSFLS